MRTIPDIYSVEPGGRYNTAAVASLLAVNRHTVSRWADAGALRSHRGANGRRWFFGKDLQTFMISYF
jgi:predicted site-specific integrase-resolvase